MIISRSSSSSAIAVAGHYYYITYNDTICVYIVPSVYRQAQQLGLLVITSHQPVTVGLLELILTVMLAIVETQVLMTRVLRSPQHAVTVYMLLLFPLTLSYSRSGTQGC